MTEGKLSSQIGHVCLNLGRIISFEYGAYYETDVIIVVLGLSNKKFQEKLEEVKKQWFYHIQEDLGYTEVDKGTITTFGYIEEYENNNSRN